MAFESAAATSVVIFGLFLVLFSLSLKPKKNSKMQPVARDFRSEARALDTGDPAAFEAFLDRWRGALPPREAREKAVMTGTLSPGEVIPWPSEITYPCWFEFRQPGNPWERKAALIGVQISNRDSRDHREWRIIRKKSV